MRVFLHIGDGKTGSSSIQASLATAQTALLDKGILYYSNNLVGHYRIAPYILEAEEERDKSPVHQSARDILDAYNRLIAAHRPHTVVLSAESFFSQAMALRLDDLLGLFEAACEDVRAICYVRSPAQRYLSQAQQNLKAGLPIIPPAQFQSLVPRVIDAWKDAIGGDRLIVRFLDRSKIVGGCVTQDFQAALAGFAGMEVDVMPSLTVNESMPVEQAILLHRMAATSDTPRDKTLFRDIQDVTRFLNAVRSKKDFPFTKARISKRAFDDLQPQTDAFEAYMNTNYPELDVGEWFAAEKADNSTGSDIEASQATVEYLFRTYDSVLLNDIGALVPRLNPALSTPGGTAAALNLWQTKHPEAVQAIYQYWATSEAMQPGQSGGGTGRGSAIPLSVTPVTRPAELSACDTFPAAEHAVMADSPNPDPAAPPLRRAIVVLGMHRSGTSAAAGVLERLGCTLPVSQISKGDQNPRGFFESWKIARHNDSVLASAGSNWHDWREINPSWIDSAPVQGLINEAVAILAEEYGGAPLIAIKDPRLCRLVDYWAKVLERAGYEPLYLNFHRNPLEVAQSLLKRNRFDPSFSKLLWLRHVLEAEAATRGQPRFFASFEQLLGSWANVITRAEEALEVNFPRMSESTAIEVESFLGKELRHYSEPADQLISNPLISNWIRKSFEILDRWSRRGAEENVDYAELDRIRAQFNTAAPAFSRFALVGETAIKDLHTATQKAEQAERDLARAQADREQLREELRQRENDVEKALRDNELLRHEVEQLTSALRQREAEAEDVSRENKSLCEDLDNRLRELGELARLLSDTESRLENAEAKKVAEVGKLRKEIDLLNKNVARRKAEAAQNAARAREAWDERDAILRSTSWRMTGPLRRIVGAFRRA